MTPLTRRGFLAAGATAAAAPAVAPLVLRRRALPVVVSSANGNRSKDAAGKTGVEVAFEKMVAGWRPVDAAVAGVAVVEDDPSDTSVGYGGLPNEDGVVELDACVMDGPSGLGGAVASLRGYRHPAQVALKVMRHTDHVLLAGEGAARFARAHGFKEEELLTERARKAWLRWKARHSERDDWLDPTENGDHGKEWMKRDTGTIHMGCVDAEGVIGGCTTTSGLAFKIPGRVGDSPLLGCGNYVDNDFGVAGSTGRGEAVILTNGASYIVGQIAAGRSAVDACLDACRRVARMTRVDRLRNERGEPNFNVEFYAIDKKGGTGGARLRGGGRYARMSENGAEFVDHAHLF